MDLAEHKLGETSEALVIETLEDCQAASLALANQAQNTLYIYSRELDPRLYDLPSFEEAVRGVAVRNRQSEVRILIRSSQHIVKYGHRLLDLARRLSSSIAIRIAGASHRNHNEAFLIADGVGYLHRTLADRFEGRADFNDPLATRELLRFFETAWEHARRDPELLRLHL